MRLLPGEYRLLEVRHPDRVAVQRHLAELVDDRGSRRIAERATQRCDVDPDIGLFDERVGPHQSRKFPLVNDLAGALDQDLQNGESPTPDVQRGIAFEQQPLGGREGGREGKNARLARLVDLSIQSMLFYVDR